jgi:predicted AlkP superfamily phosphohydrolase/phosphomutase
MGCKKLGERNCCRLLFWLSVLGGAGGYWAGCARRVTRPVTKQVVVLGFDGADPTLLSKWMAAGKLPNLARLAQTGTFETLGTINPPESPVAWASFATGLNPGGTGIFDFLKRDPKTYLPKLGLVSRKKPKFLFGLLPLRAAQVTNERHGVPFYQATADAGYKTTVIRMPLEFPPTPIPGGKLWSGLDVPDIRGTWGTFFYFGTDVTPWEEGDTEFGGRFMRLQLNRNEASSAIDGPIDPTARTYHRITVPIHFAIAPDASTVGIQLGQHTESVKVRHWSKWFHVTFKITPCVSVSAICRFYVLEISPDLRVYMCPMNIDPENPILPVSYPAGWTKELVKKYGLFKTIGWWHDTWALNEEKIGEGVFLQDLFRTMHTESKIVLDQLQHDPPSLMVAVFTATDSISHMFWRLMDPQSPRYDRVLASQYGGAILRVYEAMDQVVGQVKRAMKHGGTLIIVSDHGFHPWRKGFNTNTWLVENGYMVLKNPKASEKAYKLSSLYNQGSFFPNVDWRQTKAYALGLGQIYLNLKGREKDGIVEPGPEADQVLQQLRGQLLAYRDPDTHKPVLEDVYLAREIDHGAYMSEAPDLQLNFYPGYRTSWQTALGAIPQGVVVANLKKWSGDHCAADPKDTGGILLIDRKLSTSNPTIEDVAPTVLKLLGVSAPDKLDGRAWSLSEPAVVGEVGHRH